MNKQSGAQRAFDSTKAMRQKWSGGIGMKKKKTAGKPLPLPPVRVRRTGNDKWKALEEQEILWRQTRYELAKARP